MAYLYDKTFVESSVEDIQIVKEFSDVLPEELLGYHQIGRLSSVLRFFLE